MQERDSNLSFATVAEMAEGKAVFPEGVHGRFVAEAFIET